MLFSDKGEDIGECYIFYHTYIGYLFLSRKEKEFCIVCFGDDTEANSIFQLRKNVGDARGDVNG